MNSSSKVQASAILAVYNADTTIEACIKSLLAQSLPIEIICIDDGSTDGTLKILNQFKKITVLNQGHAGPAIARNLGAKHAQSNILLFVDADMTFDPEYVKELIAPIQQGQVIGTYTTEEIVSNWNNIWARCVNIQEGWQNKKRFPENPPKYGTDFRAILKSEFVRVGGFDNIGYTDTWSLFHKLGERPLATKATCYHQNPDNLKSVFLQAKWSAKRPYKLGIAGIIYALIRTSFLVSIVVGLIYSVREPAFFTFKIFYDLGRFIGIIEMIFGEKLTK